MAGRVWTLSNLLSAVRVLLVVPIARLLLLPGGGPQAAALVLIVIAAATDLFDGLLARRLGQVSEVGKIIDPLADKIAIGAIVVILAIQGRLPVWLLVMILIRDILIFSGGVAVRNSRGIVLQSNWAGKWTSGILALTIFLLVLDLPSLAAADRLLIIGSAVMVVLSFVLYAIRFISVLGPSRAAASPSSRLSSRPPAPTRQ